MTRDDRAAIDDLFGKLATVESRAPERDPEAEALIAERLRRQPGAAYYMAQTIVAQEQALIALQDRVAALEAQAVARSGGGGFLAGAAQTAMGVAGGMLIADALGGVFGADAAPEEDPLSSSVFDDGGFDEDL